MRNLIKLELRKNNIRTYIAAAIWITVAIIGFLYVFAATPHIETGDPDMGEFISYTNISAATVVINMAAFCVLSSVMYARFIIEEYKGARLVLLFSYPVSRKKLFLSKVTLISICTGAGLLISNLVAFSLFFGIESVFPLVSDHVTFGLILQLLFLSLMTAVLAAAIGAISMIIGFRKKSTSATIVSAIVLIAVISSGTSNFGIPMAAVTVILLLVATVLTKLQLNKVQCMET